MFMAMLCPGLAEPAGAASGQILQIFPVWWWWWWCVRDREESGARPGQPLAGTARLAKVTLSHSLAGKWVMFTTAAVQCTVYSGLYNECTYATCSRDEVF